MTVPTGITAPLEDDALEFTEVRKSKLVKITDKVGETKRYWLVEMMQPDVARWMEYTTTRIVKTDRKGRPDPNSVDFSDYHSTLISLCLYYEGGQERVPAKYIKENFTGSLISGLFDQCQTMNGLNEEGREQVKKA